MNVKINKDILAPYLLFNKSIKYNEHITLYPVIMNDILTFQILIQSITLRKNSIFKDKKIIKMSYLDFLFYCLGNKEIEKTYKIAGLSQYYFYAIQLLQLCCKDAEIKLNEQTGKIYINSELITSQIFDDIRRIIIIQNGVDFNIDEFMNQDTEKRLLQIKKDMNKDEISLEDYIDSLIIALNTTEERIMNMTIRKFWRYIKRYKLYESYTIAKTGECSGMVKFKEPIKYWMNSLDENKDKYKDLKTSETELRNKIEG